MRRLPAPLTGSADSPCDRVARRRSLGAAPGLLLLFVGLLLLAVVWPVAPAAAATVVGDTPLPCANGLAVPASDQHPGLVSDCETLLGLRDELRGRADLDWNAQLPIAQWRGITLGGSPPRVLRLRLRYLNLDGTIPTALSGLTKLQQLQLSDNRLRGTIPSELAGLGELTVLFLANNQLSGAIPPALGGLTKLESLDLSGNQLSGPIPSGLAERWQLRHLTLDRNRLSGTVPYWLDDLSLESLNLAGNAGLTGCIPDGLRQVRDNDLARSGLGWCAPLPRRTLTTSSGTGGVILPPPGQYRYRQGARLRLQTMSWSGNRVAEWSGACAGDAPSCVVTMDTDRSVGVTFELATYSLTVSATEGGAVSPSGTTSYPQPTTVTLQASWNDATHTFAGWSGACAGDLSTCELLVDDDLSVSAAFSALPAERCSSPTDADCIRAVFRGAPGDYPQVSDIPPAELIAPGADGRYRVERGQRVTVVTAARLPTGYTRFYLQQDPLERPPPVSFSQLIPPVGTTYTFTPTEDAYGATLLGFDLTAAKPPLRPGLKLQLGDIVATTRFQVQPQPLSLELTSSRQLCTAGALTELSWTISGGQPPYTLTIDGRTVDAKADSHRVNCGPLKVDPLTSEPLIDQFKTFQALVTDEHGVGASAEATAEVLGAGAPTLSAQTAASGSVALTWSAESTTGVTFWEYRQRPGDGEWGRWTRIAGSDPATTGHTVSGLTEDARYSFHLRAVSGSVAGPRSATASAIAGLTPTTRSSDYAKLIYNELDSAGGATQSGSYAFLTDATDLTSGATTFAQVSSATALLVNTSGYRDQDYTSTYAAVQLGDRFTWHATTGCWYHFRVTAVLPDPPGSMRKLVGIALETEDPCAYMADSVKHFDSRRHRRASLVWNSIPPDEPKIGPDGIRSLMYRYPVEGGHTYRLTALGWPTPLVIDLPVGMRLIELGGFVPSDGPLMISYLDAVSGATLLLDAYGGEDFAYFRVSNGTPEQLPADLVAKFEAIIASLREAPLP